jgi:hypothetical protein
MSPATPPGPPITVLGLDTTLLQTTDRFSTGAACGQVGPGVRTSFAIERPAAYDAVELLDADIRQVVHWHPAWTAARFFLPGPARVT